MALSISESVCIAKTKVNEFYIIVDMGEQDIIWLQIKVKHLMTMQVSKNAQQLTNELVCMFLFFEIIRIVGY